MEERETAARGAGTPDHLRKVRRSGEAGGGVAATARHASCPLQVTQLQPGKANPELLYRSLDGRRGNAQLDLHAIATYTDFLFYELSSSRKLFHQLGLAMVSEVDQPPSACW